MAQKGEAKSVHLILPNQDQLYEQSRNGLELIKPQNSETAGTKSSNRRKSIKASNNNTNSKMSDTGSKKMTIS